MYHLSHWCKWFVFLSTVGPHFVSDPVASQEVVINGEINLTCSAEGFPRPSIVWFMNNTMINDGMTDVVESPMNVISSTLMISNAVFSDSGMYYCQALSDEFDDDLSTTSKIAIITVVGKLVNDIELLSITI